MITFQEARDIVEKATGLPTADNGFQSDAIFSVRMEELQIDDTLHLVFRDDGTYVPSVYWDYAELVADMKQVSAE